MSTPAARTAPVPPPAWLRPVTATAPRPPAEELRRSVEEPAAFARREVLYIRSYLVLRSVIGFLGLALPVALVGGDLVFRIDDPRVRGSLSAYYYSGTREVFVGALCVIGVFLVTYKVLELNLDNTASIVAGVAALGVAVFPTSRPAAAQVELTPLQERLGETLVATVHGVCAAVFIGLLGLLSYYFGKRERGRSQDRDDHRARLPPEFWQRFHWTCTAVIGLAVVFFGVATLLDLFDGYALLIAETVAALAFGTSWLAKGLELDVLLPRRT